MNEEASAKKKKKKILLIIHNNKVFSAVDERLQNTETGLMAYAHGKATCMNRVGGTWNGDESVLQISKHVLYVLIPCMMATFVSCTRQLKEGIQIAKS